MVLSGGQSQGTWGDQGRPSALQSLLPWGAVQQGMGWCCSGAQLAHVTEATPPCGVQIPLDSIEGVWLRQDPWVPGAQLEHSAQGKAVQPGLCGCTSELSRVQPSLHGNPLRLCYLGAGLVETSGTKLTGVLPVIE